MSRRGTCGLTSAVLALALLPGTAEGGLPDTPRKKVLYRDGHPDRYLIDSGWERRLDPGDEGLGARWQLDQSAEGWTPVEVPDAWNAQDLTPASQEGGVAWYRARFTVPEGTGGSRWAIRFESVNLRATVWVNGVRERTHTGAHLPFEASGDELKDDEENLVVARVDNRRLPTDLPPFERSGAGLPGGGWWNDGGILREVYLRRLPDVDVASLHVRAQADGLVRVRASLVNTTGEARRTRPEIRIGSRRVPLREGAVPVRGSRRISATIRLTGPRPWSLNRPFLYPLRILDRGQLIWEQRIGLREWKVEGGLLHLNGRRVRLFGASVHEDEPVRGRAQSPDRRAADLKALFELGATVTRAHYPLHPAILEELDRRGIALWQQIPAYRYSNEALADAGVRRQAVSYLERALRRDRNHPSLLAYSVGNELPSRPREGVRRYIRSAGRRVRRTAPGILAALDVSSYPTVGKKDVYEESLDALGLNEYFGWYLGPRRTTADRRILGPYLARSRRDYPGLALFVTEFGAEANRSGDAADKGTYEFQSAYLRNHMREIARRRYVNGAIVWLLRDFRTRPAFTGGNPQPQPPMNQKGLLDYTGAKKPAYTAFRSLIRRAGRR